MYHKSFLFYSLHQKGNCFILTVLNLLVKSLFFPCISVYNHNVTIQSQPGKYCIFPGAAYPPNNKKRREPWAAKPFFTLTSILHT